MALQLFKKEQVPLVGEPLRIKDAVEVIAFMLHDAGVKALYLLLDQLALHAGRAVADPQMTRDDPAQARYG